jgi:hypothetical protein
LRRRKKNADARAGRRVLLLTAATRDNPPSFNTAQHCLQ